MNIPSHVADVLSQYELRVLPKDEDGHHIVVCDAFPLFSAFGETPDEALAEARIALTAMIEIHLEEGTPLPSSTTYSNDLHVRLPKSLHARLAHQAKAEGVSLNLLIATRLASS